MKQFFTNIKSEMRHVVWPSRQQTIAWTALVIVISLAVAYYLFGLDWLFGELLDLVL